MRKTIKGIIAVFGACILLGYPELLHSHSYKWLSNVAQNSTIPARQVVSKIIPTPDPEYTLLDQTTLVELVNKLRSNQQQPALKMGKQTCALLSQMAKEPDLSEAKIFSICPSCARVQFITINQPVNQYSVEKIFTNDLNAAKSLTDDALTHICGLVDASFAYIAFVEARETESATKPVSVAVKDISEDELWSAFSEYRKSQGRTQLERDENLCVYARKRVSDHLNFLAENKAPESYPVPEKYPLDAHDGFKKDAQSELVFSITKKNEVAENLAYWPSAQHAVHVIEWGWDTSTEGHREAQLSNDWSVACLTGQKGFYVAIFAK